MSIEKQMLKSHQFNLRIFQSVQSSEKFILQSISVKNEKWQSGIGSIKLALMQNYLL